MYSVSDIDPKIIAGINIIIPIPYSGSVKTPTINNKQPEAVYLPRLFFFISLPLQFGHMFIIVVIVVPF